MNRVRAFLLLLISVRSVFSWWFCISENGDDFADQVTGQPEVDSIKETCTTAADFATFEDYRAFEVDLRYDSDPLSFTLSACLSACIQHEWCVAFVWLMSCDYDYTSDEQSPCHQSDFLRNSESCFISRTVFDADELEGAQEVVGYTSGICVPRGSRPISATITGKRLFG